MVIFTLNVGDRMVVWGLTYVAADTSAPITNFGAEPPKSRLLLAKYKAQASLPSTPK